MCVLYVGPCAVAQTHKVGKLRIALCTRTLVLRWRHSTWKVSTLHLHHMNINRSWRTFWFGLLQKSSLLFVRMYSSIEDPYKILGVHPGHLWPLIAMSLRCSSGHHNRLLSNWLRFFCGGGKSCVSQSCSPDASRFNWKQRGSEEASVFLRNMCSH